MLNQVTSLDGKYTTGGGSPNGRGSATAGTVLAAGGTASSSGGSSVAVDGESAGGAGGAATSGGNSSVSGNVTGGDGKAAGGKSSVGGNSSTNAGATNCGGTNAMGGTSATGATSSAGGKAAGGTSALGGASSGGIASTAGAAGKPFRGVANSNCAQRTALNVSWYYNWETAPREPCSSPSIGGEYVPLIKGNQHRTPDAVAGAITSIVNAGYKTVLGFNEPNKGNQGDQTVDLSVSLWPSLLDSALRVGSPATSAEKDPGQVWFTTFMSQVSANPALRVDFIAIHWYAWETGSCDANATQLENYIKWAEGFPGNRPIWITEFGCSNLSNPDAATVLAFFRGALTMFARHPRLERYAWYPGITNNGLVNADGTLTPLGAAFAAAPAKLEASVPRFRPSRRCRHC